MCLGIPGQVVAVADVEEQRVVAEVEGVRREVSAALLGIRTADGVVAVGGTSGQDAVEVGDWVLIHVGFAMSRIDEDEARETRRALKMFAGEFEQEIAEFAGDPSGWDPFEAVGFRTPQAARAAAPGATPPGDATPASGPRRAPRTPRAAPGTPPGAPPGDDARDA